MHVVPLCRWMWTVILNGAMPITCPIATPPLSCIPTGTTRNTPHLIMHHPTHLSMRHQCHVHTRYQQQGCLHMGMAGMDQRTMHNQNVSTIFSRCHRHQATPTPSTSRTQGVVGTPAATRRAVRTFLGPPAQLLQDRQLARTARVQTSMTCSNLRLFQKHRNRYKSMLFDFYIFIIWNMALCIFHLFNFICHTQRIKHNTITVILQHP